MRVVQGNDLPQMALRHGQVELIDQGGRRLNGCLKVRCLIGRDAGLMTEGAQNGLGLWGEGRHGSILESVDSVDVDLLDACAPHVSAGYRCMLPLGVDLYAHAGTVEAVV